MRPYRRKLINDATPRGIGGRMRAARAALELKQADFAKALGISQGHLSSVEAGKYTPGIDVLVELARAFPTINVHWILEGRGSIFVEQSTLLGVATAALDLPAVLAAFEAIEHERPKMGKPISGELLGRYFALLYERYMNRYLTLRKSGVAESEARRDAAVGGAILAGEFTAVDLGYDVSAVMGRTKSGRLFVEKTVSARVQAGERGRWRSRRRDR